MFPRLHERQNALASALSGGERAFLGLAQLLVAGCSVLLLDEPSAGLAPAAIKELFQLLDIIGHETGATMLIVEQNAAAALQICDRVYVMNSGKIVATGSPDELAVRSDIIDAYLQF
jgi:branched-chain amino acid transport system ATP-binding protein